MTLPTRDQLVKRRGIVLLDMAAKMEAEDFHGVADCAMDAREIDAMLRVIDAFIDPLNQKAPLRLYDGWSTLTDSDIEGAILPNGDVVGKRAELQWPDSIRAERMAAGRPVLAVKADAD